MGWQGASLGFQAGTVPWERDAPHEPGREPGPVAEREWGLSAGQVVAVVLVILAVCEVIGLLS